MGKGTVRCWSLMAMLAAWLLCGDMAKAQTVAPDSLLPVETVMPSAVMPLPDTVRAAQLLADSLTLDRLERKPKRDWATWTPSPKRALWLALVLPGAGQIYNRKYWKLPIVYGGFVGCAYAMRWNNQMFHDYSQAYMDLMDDDPTTESYNQFMHLGAQINASNMSRYQTLFQKRKDRYRRWRDMSFFVMVGVYALSVVDAYVDASLSEFDISGDLSLHLAPAVIGGPSERGMSTARPGAFSRAGIGIECSLNF